MDEKKRGRHILQKNTAQDSLKGNWTSISKTSSGSEEVKTFMTSLLAFSPWWCIGHQNHKHHHRGQGGAPIPQSISGQRVAPILHSLVTWWSSRRKRKFTVANAV
ncbi:hypothetical protein HanRHA438_Chr08g0364751 [Helianthus annuus]|uniref:Putative dinB/YfiT-like putative metal-dependent hydrolase n=1 Tax=Helianthus annuus TaxID=4232 RepID=A0A251UBA5_HELAN|nr:hypothetical protein HanXRQr2_Chr08g0352571 [Helianthus annuus]KAJ0539824.1 hypothetical protein HanHA300_Chr08g0290891 [Helianthus annuus]KAJ0548143.1 hypothetical protein HanIR_Chr08g0380241 [Helianthus annuus]KAJ0554560.1 hypothetical protein HanHA89_Chr08g0309311 [Helianthus annuus]KAJ0720125.1 hypothetical protein HanLR1_Chr08g0289661 [Helianthus annuus]